MKSRLGTLLIFIISLYAKTAAAQASSISGRVNDDGGKGVDAATVIVINLPDSSIAKADITDSRGEFSIPLFHTGSYLLKVVAAGYTTYSSEAIQVSSDVKLPAIVLNNQSTALKEVSVRAQKPFVEVHPDRLVVNVENSIVSAGGSALDVLSHSPGITIDQSDNISLKGKQGVNVMINGKVQPMSGQDLANMLKSMPSNAIESIELISNPSAKYDAAGTAGIINIKTKKGNKAGLNGSVNGTYAQGIYGKGNAGFNANYRVGKLNVFANYNESLREGFNHLTLDRNFLSNNVFAGAYEQDNHYLYHITGHTGNLGVDYNLTSKTIIGAQLSGDATMFRRDGSNYSAIVDSGNESYMKQHPSAHFVTKNTTPNHWNNYAANVNLRHTFDSSGTTLTVDADYASYPSHGTQDYTTTYYDTALAPAILHGEQLGLTQIRSFKADFTKPLPGNAKLEAGAKTSYVTADNKLDFYNVVNDVRIPDNTRTNHFIYHENINAAYATFSKDWDKWSTQLGLRTEQTIADGRETTTDTSFTRNYVQLFPSLMAQRHLDKNNDLGLTVSRRIERPNYEQLNPFKSYLDPTTYKSGYPYLSPALSYAMELTHVYKQKLITTLNYTHTSLPIVEVIQPSTEETKVTIQTTKNLTGMDYYGINGSYQLTFYKWWSNTTNVNVYYAHYTGNIAGSSLSAGNVTFDINTINSFILPKSWSAELSLFYQAPQVYGYMNVNPNWMLNAGIQKNLFDKRATLRINTTDIFWRGYPSATSYYNNYRESFIAKRDTRQTSASFTWRFGKRAGPQAKRRSGAEDEKRRIGGQGG